MAFQIVLVVEADEVSKTDFIYINSVLNELYSIRERTDIKISPVYMRGKGNYKKAATQIKKHQNAYKKIGNTHVIYCFDTDKFESNPEDGRVLREEEKYCLNNGYDFVWFCHDIEEVFLGKSVSKSEKKDKSRQYIVRHGIEKVKINNLKSEVKVKGKSNLLVVLKNIFDNSCND